MAKIGATDEPTVGESETGSLSWGCAPGFIVQDVSREPFEVLVWKVTLCIAQSIDGLCWSHHEYPRTADIK